MDYNFKKFENTHGKYEHRITITSSNSIGFPTQFFKDNKIDDFKFVVLYYDEEKKALGIQFTNSEQELHKFTIVKSKEGYGGSIVAASFFKKFNINARSYKGKYEWQKEENTPFGTLFIIELKEK